MKLAIIRTANSELDPNMYNVQEIGLARSLLKFDFSVDIYSLFKNIKSTITIAEQKDNKINLIPLKGIKFKQVTWFSGLRRELQQGGYDYLQVHEDSQLMNSFLLKWAKKANIKTILYQGMYENYSGISGIYQNILDSFSSKRIKQNCDIFFAKTRYAKNYLSNKGYNNIYINAIGLDFKNKNETYSKIETVKKFKNKFQYLGLYVGVIEPRRDLSFLLYVLREILHLRDTNYLGLVIVGKGPDLDKIEKRANELGIKSNILFIKSVPNNQIGNIFKACDMFLLPSHYEIYGMVVMEALYNGIPVISSKTAGSVDIIKNDYYGKIFPMQKKIWIEGILEYFNTKYIDKNLSCFRTNCILENYNWDYLSKQYISTITNETMNNYNKGL